MPYETKLLIVLAILFSLFAGCVAAELVGGNTKYNACSSGSENYRRQYCTEFPHLQ